MTPLTFRVKPGSTLNLDDYDPRYDGKLKRKEAEAAFAGLTAEIDALQELLYGAGSHSLLVVFQGMDTSGKDGSVRSVFSQVSPLGSYVVPFKVPSAEELSHDFLWRAHKVVPPKGVIGIFNRSYYEDVLVVRVHSLVPEPVWRGRYEQINAFEQLLTASNTIVLKFFLHISKAEQEQRLREREQDAAKAWKLSAGDWRERERWDEYMAAYTDALSQCSSEHAPWQIVPADRKWYRNYAIAQAVIAALSPYKEQWLERLGKIGAAAKDELEAYRKEKK